MALNKSVADFLARALPRGGDLLELGESAIAEYNAPLDLFNIIKPYVPPECYDEALRRLAESEYCVSNYQRNAGPARAFYHAVFEPALYVSIELGLAPRRLCVDLNGPVEVGRQFDVVVNNGTTEHLFDQGNAYRLIHRCTRTGGVMVHWMPCIGWINHGLFHAQPGFFFDLAAANGYEIKLIGLETDDIFFPLENGEAFKRPFGKGFHLTTVCDSSSGCGQSRAVAGWPRSPRRPSATRLT